MYNNAEKIIHATAHAYPDEVIMIGPASARTNIVCSMAARLVSMVVGVVSVPLLLSLLGADQYGTWVTLTSLVAFIGLLDFGVGNSMRNSVAAMSPEKSEAVRAEFIGFFRLLCLVGFIATACLVIIVPLFDFFHGYSIAVLLLYMPLLLLLPLMLGSSVLQGAHAMGLQSVLQASSNWGFIAFVGLLAWFNFTPSINNLSILWSLCNLVPLLLIFKITRQKLQVSLAQLVGLPFASLPKDRLRMGIEFFVLQLSSLILFSLGNILVFDQLGANEVARYDILNKVFQIGLNLYGIVIAVMWSEIAKLRAEGNVIKLERIFRRLATIAGLFTALCLIGAFAAPSIISLWTQQRIHVAIQEALAIAGLVSVQALAYVGAVFMNAFEQIRTQLALSIMAIILMIPLAMAFFKLGMGIVSVPLASIMLTFISVFVCNICALRLLHGMREIQVHQK